MSIYIIMTARYFGHSLYFTSRTVHNVHGFQNPNEGRIGVEPSSSQHWHIDKVPMLYSLENNMNVAFITHLNVVLIMNNIFFFFIFHFFHFI